MDLTCHPRSLEGRWAFCKQAWEETDRETWNKNISVWVWERCFICFNCKMFVGLLHWNRAFLLPSGQWCACADLRSLPSGVPCDFANVAYEATQSPSCAGLKRYSEKIGNSWLSCPNCLHGPQSIHILHQNCWNPHDHCCCVFSNDQRRCLIYSRELLFDLWDAAFGDLEARIDQQVDLEVAAASAVKGARLTLERVDLPIFVDIFSISLVKTNGSWQQVLIVSRHCFARALLLSL